MNFIGVKARQATALISILLLSYIVTGTAGIMSNQYEQLRFYNKYIVIVVIIFSVAQCFHKNWFKELKIDANAIMFALFILLTISYDIIHGSFVGAYPKYSWIFSKAYILYILLYLNISKVCDMRKPLMILFGFICFAIAAFYYYILQSDSILSLAAGTRRIHAEAIGVEMNANTVAYITVVGLLVYFRMIEIYTRRSKQILLFILPAVFITALFLTTLNRSITATFMILVFSAWYLVSKCNVRTLKHLLPSVILLFLLLGYGAIEYADIYKKSNEAILLRVEEGGSYNHRKEEGRVAWDLFTERPLLGNPSSELYRGGSNANHAFHLNVLSMYGLIGFTLYFAIYFTLFRRLCSNVQLTQWMAFGFFIGYLFMAPPYPFLAIPLLLMKQNQPVLHR